MDNMEFNKIFAAVLVAGIVASLTGFISHTVIHPHKLHDNAYKIEGVVEDGAAGVAAPTGPQPILAMLASADVARGEQAAKACAACHSFNKGGANGIGPNLYGIVNANKAHLAGFAYSDGMKAKGGKWDYDSLNHMLWKPKAYIADTKMNFIGLKKPEDRAAVIAWLRTLSDSPAGLPSASQISAEEAELAPPAPAAEAAPAADAAPAEAAPAH
ncbi:c-type cytochrome [Micavibrio aeruginosavorus]|uniref:c-type cytochrome n=1 Tax=Micavibrio aeruginosavorus TaxID=349221 RepID=UPI003F4AB1CA